MTDVLTATYRVQFRPEFTLKDAAAMAPYLKRLGISHLYASPYLQATPGSTHGYDIVDFGKVSRELGGLKAHQKLAEALRAEDMGQILDMVPNHMAISPENPWWWDVLENGPSSRYAEYFDVEWDPPETRHRNVVLLPVLGDQYGRELEAQKIQLSYETARSFNEQFTVHYYDHVYPVDPQTLSRLLHAAGTRIQNDTLIFLGGAFGRLPVATATDRGSANRRSRDASVLYALLQRLASEQAEVAQAIETEVTALNQDVDALDAFLSKQNYRLAYWEISARELGYRRFFDINTMIGLRMEDAQVYQDTHEQVLQWLNNGLLDGLRIDHPDGLLNPEAYFRRLRGSTTGRPVYLVVEKIVEPGEKLPETWPVDGTTGYDFLNRVNGVQIDPRAEGPLSEFYAAFTGRAVDYPALVREKKLYAAREILGSDLSRLTELLSQITGKRRLYRDYTRNVLSHVLAEMAAALPVYRTYVCTSSAAQACENAHSPADERYIHQAIEMAKANRPELDPRLFDFLRDMLLLRERDAMIEVFVERFQQFTGPVMAKGVEDTVFYLYNRFVSLNEVGGDPGHFGLAVDSYHQANEQTQRCYPRAMLATSTHDTKRSEDVRARLNVLSEQPEMWIDAVKRWSGINERYRNAATGWPDRNSEYLLYQTLLGAWPIETERVLKYMEKAGREAKEFTTWTAPNAAYEGAVADFARGILADTGFTRDLEALVEQVREPGWINSLAQTLLKLTSPGVPDIYQGCEVWNFSLVDPDNRRPVDYTSHLSLLKALEGAVQPEHIWKQAESGLPKLWVIRQALALRARHPDWFGERASYTPLVVREEQAIAYVRSGKAAVIVPRLVTRFRGAWGKVMVGLPAGEWRNWLTGETLPGGEVSLAKVFARFPVALLERVLGA